MRHEQRKKPKGIDMKTWKASFVGRNNGAIGIMYNIITTVEGETKEDAQLRLCDKYDHIDRLTLEIDTE